LTLPDAATARATAAQGWIYGYALLENDPADLDGAWSMPDLTVDRRG
jgi:hypothetical protein